MTLVATRPIPAGTVVWVLCEFDLVLDRSQLPEMSCSHRDILDRYAFISPEGEILLQWDLARFGNHSCDAALQSVRYDVEIAVRDVAAGEQITTEYGNLNRDFEFACSCGSPHCRTWIRHDDCLRHGERWDGLVAAALPRYADVHQPLADVLARRPDALAILEGRRPPLRSRDGYCPPHRLPDLSPPPEQGTTPSALARSSARSRYSVTMPLANAG